MARAIAVEIVGDASSVNRAFRSASNGARTFERDIGRSSRGVIAGSGAFRSLGRSIAFASSSFLGGYGFVAAVRSVIGQASRIQEETEKTGVVFAKNAKQVQAWSKTLTTSFGVSEGAALEAAGTFGNMLRPLGFGAAAAARMSERLVQLSADMASFNNTKPDVVLQALSSGLAGQVRPLRQYGVFLSETRIKQEAVADGIAKTGANLSQAQKVQASYNIILKDTKLQQGDVARNTGSLSVATSKFTAAIQNLEADLGRKFLPTLTDVTNRAAQWLGNQENIDKITRSVNHVVDEGVGIFKALRSVVHGVDKVTGSFLHTLELLAVFKFASMVTGWIGGLDRLILKWKGVRRAAIEAEGAQAAAGGGGAGAGVGLVSGPGLLAAGAVGFGALTAHALTSGTGPSRSSGRNRVVISGVGVFLRQGSDGKWYRPGPRGVMVAATPEQAAQAEELAGGGPPIPVGAIATRPQPGLSRFGAPARNIFTPPPPPTQRIFTQQFQLTAREDLAAAQASLTRGTADDVAAAKQVVARVKRLVAEGRLKGKALLQALGLEASALSTIWSAEDAAAQKRAQAAARAKARIAAQIQNSIDPIKLELQLSKDQALRRDTTKDLEALRRAAYKALRSGKLSLEQQKEAWDQIASINQQLEQSAASSTAQFKQLNTRKLTAGLGLTPEQRKALRARLSQRGPNGTAPGQGTGAYGYTIGRSGRPIHVHNHVHLDGKEIEHSTTRHRQRRRRRNSSQRRGPNAGG